MNAQQQFEKWYAIERRACGLRVHAKDKKLKWMWKFIHWFLYCITFGKQDAFYDNYTTTIGKNVYYPAGWTSEEASLWDCVVLRHEGKHTRQCIKWGCGNATIGTLVMGLLFLLVPLPIGFAWFRYKFEREAYKVSYYTALSLGLKPNLDRYVEQLTGPAYFWTWVLKKQVKNWFYANCHPSMLEANLPQS